MLIELASQISTRMDPASFCGAGVGMPKELPLTTPPQPNWHADRWLGVIALLVTIGLLVAPGEWLEEYLLRPLIRWWGDDPIPKDTEWPVDKLVHFSLFLVTGWLLARGWLSSYRWYGLATGLLSVAVVTEAVQAYIPGRHFDLLDMLANASGSLFGLAIGGWLWARRRRRRSAAPLT